MPLNTWNVKQLSPQRGTSYDDMEKSNVLSLSLSLSLYLTSSSIRVDYTVDVAFFRHFWYDQNLLLKKN